MSASKSMAVDVVKNGTLSAPDLNVETDRLATMIFMKDAQQAVQEEIFK
jgi:hypothetical protein